MPSSPSRLTVAKMSLTTRGARPIEGSSSMSRVGRAIRARAMASICCSPPESVPASWRLRWRSTGKSPYIFSRSSSASRRRPRRYWRWAPRSRFSWTGMAGNTWRPSGTSEQPRAAVASVRSRRTSSPWKSTSPAWARTSPVMVRRRVDFPAPLAPMSETISPLFTCRETRRKT